MKVMAFNGSPRTNGNTTILINYVLDELQKEGIETEHYLLAGKEIHGCRACYQCAQNKDRRCNVGSDIVNECIEKMLEADGIILGSPTYFSDLSTEIKALIDRAGLVAKVNNDMFKRKVGAAVVAVRRGGAVHVFSSINYFFLINQMIVPGSSYWNFGVGHDRGDVEKDAEGIGTMKTLGQNMAWLLKKMQR
jgi:multimeric flavodoxin WrbA